MKILFLTVAKIRGFCETRIQSGINSYIDHLKDNLTCEHDVVTFTGMLNSTDLQNNIDTFITKACEYDVVHVQYEPELFTSTQDDESDAITRFSKLLEKLHDQQTPVVVTFHSGPVFYTSKIRFNIDDMLRWLLSRLWRNEIACWFQPEYNITAIVHTEQTKTEFVESTFNEQNVHVIPHGVSKFTRKPFSAISTNEIVNLGVFGFISEHKGYENALKVLEYLPSNYKLILMGGRHPNSTGSYIGKILKLINKNPAIKSRVTVTGYLNENQIYEWFSKCHICLNLHTEDQLSASGAISWSLSSGIPTIASDIPCYVNIYNQFQCLKMFKSHDVEELSKTIKHVASDVSLQQELSNNSNKYCEEHGWSSVACSHVELYTKHMSLSALLN